MQYSSNTIYNQINTLHSGSCFVSVILGRVLHWNFSHPLRRCKQILICPGTHDHPLSTYNPTDRFYVPMPSHIRSRMNSFHLRTVFFPYIEIQILRFLPAACPSPRLRRYYVPIWQILYCLQKCQFFLIVSISRDLCIDQLGCVLS